MARLLFEFRATRRRAGILADAITYIVWDDEAATVLADISATSGGSPIAGSTVLTADIAGLGPAACRFYGPTDGQDTLWVTCPADATLGVQKVDAQVDARLDALEAGSGGAHPNLATHDALGLATDAELAAHGADTTAVHGIADTAQLARRDEVNTFTLDQVFKSGRPVLDVDSYIRPLGTEPGVSAANDTLGIDQAGAALEAMGGGFLWFNNRDYLLTRLIALDQESGCITWRPGVSLVFAGTTLRLQHNTYIIKAKRPLSATTATINADVAVGDFTANVNSSSGFTVGDMVFVRAGDNPYDSVETNQAFYARVEALTGTTITLDQPFREAMVVATTEAANEIITKLNPMVEDVALIGHVNLVNDIAGGGNAEAGMDLRYTRNLRIDSVSGEHLGTGLMMIVYANSLRIGNLHLRECDAQNGQASKGRALNIGNSDNIHIATFLAERFETVALFMESFNRKIRIDHLHLRNTHPDRDNATVGIIQVAQSCELTIDHLLVEGVGGAVLVDEGGTTGNRIALSDVELQMAPQLKGGLLLHYAKPGAQFRAGSTQFSEIKVYSKTFRLTASMAGVDPGLPSGLYRRVRVYVSTKTGLTFFYVGGNDVLASLTAGDAVELNPAVFGAYGSDVSFNNTMAKALALHSDGTVPAGAWAAIEVEYYPDVVDDGALARQQVPYNYIGLASKPTLAAAASDPATTQTLANDLRTKLIEMGLAQ